ncbi:UNVERIFIED_CONTAM: hypothetical protein FKN15_067555 [Acipenser sinensis]
MVTAYDCAQKKATDDVLVRIDVKPVCKPAWQGWNKRVEYEPGTGSKLLFPTTHLETCDEPVSSIRVTVELQTNHIGKGCDRETYSEKSLQKLCGASSGSTDLLPASSATTNWTATLLTDSGRDSDLIFKFDGRQAAKIPDRVVPKNLTDQFTIATWMKHGPSPGLRAEKETILCNSDKTEMNRHHYAFYVHNCRLVFLLRRDFDQVDTFRPAEYHWKLEQFHFNPSQSTLVMEGDDIEYISQALRKVSYINSRQFPTPGIRRLKTSTTVQCYGEDTCISIPDVDAFIVVLQPSEPRITITGMDHFARLDTEFESSEGLVLFPNVRIISTVTKTDLPPQGKAHKHGRQEEIIHNLDYCDILVIGNELDPDQESLQLNRNELHGKHLDATNSTSGISIYAIPSAATVVIVVCISSLLLIVVLGIYRIRVARLHSSESGGGAKENQMDWDDSALTITVNPMENYEEPQQANEDSDEEEEEEEDEMEEDDITSAESDVSDDEEAVTMEGQRDGKRREQLEWDNSTLRY